MTGTLGECFNLPQMTDSAKMTDEDGWLNKMWSIKS